MPSLYMPSGPRLQIIPAGSIDPLLGGVTSCLSFIIPAMHFKTGFHHQYRCGSRSDETCVSGNAPCSGGPGAASKVSQHNISDTFINTRDHLAATLAACAIRRRWGGGRGVDGPTLAFRLSLRGLVMRGRARRYGPIECMLDIRGAHIHRYACRPSF